MHCSESEVCPLKGQFQNGQAQNSFGYEYVRLKVVGEKEGMAVALSWDRLQNELAESDLGADQE